MVIKVRVTPNSKSAQVSQKGDFFIVRVKEPAKEDRANKAMVNALSKYFNISKSQVIIKKGRKSRTKEVEII